MNELKIKWIKYTRVSVYPTIEDTIKYPSSILYFNSEGCLSKIGGESDNEFWKRFDYDFKDNRITKRIDIKILDSIDEIWEKYDDNFKHYIIIKRIDSKVGDPIIIKTRNFNYYDSEFSTSNDSSFYWNASSETNEFYSNNSKFYLIREISDDYTYTYELNQNMDIVSVYFHENNIFDFLFHPKGERIAYNHYDSSGRKIYRILFNNEDDYLGQRYEIRKFIYDQDNRLVQINWTTCEFYEDVEIILQNDDKARYWENIQILYNGKLPLYIIEEDTKMGDNISKKLVMFEYGFW
ncbi:MAG: hypothetical protein V1779_16655 [bacterium]